MLDAGFGKAHLKWARSPGPKWRGLVVKEPLAAVVLNQGTVPMPSPSLDSSYDQRKSMDGSSAPMGGMLVMVACSPAPPAVCSLASPVVKMELGGLLQASSGSSSQVVSVTSDLAIGGIEAGKERTPAEMKVGGPRTMGLMVWGASDGQGLAQSGGLSSGVGEGILMDHAKRSLLFLVE